jgi:hypothetical protein
VSPRKQREKKPVNDGRPDQMQAAEDLEAILEGLALSLAAQGRSIAEFLAEFETEQRPIGRE